MQVSVEQIGSLERKMTIRVPSSRIEQRVQERLRELGQTVRIKGFRAGKIPGKIIEQRYGDQVRNEAMSDVVGSSFEQAVGENNLRPAMQPSIRRDDQSTDTELVFTATFEVVPEIGEVDVSGLELNRLVSQVEDADVERMIETLRQQRKRWVVVERAAQIGDMVLFEYSAVADGQRFPAEGMERAGTIFGSGALPPAFEAALADAVADTARSFTAEFPEGFRQPVLAGKSADVELRVIRIQASEIPEVDNAFAASFGVAAGGIAKFREDVRANLEREMRSALNSRNKMHAVERLVRAYASFELPKGMVDAEARAMQRQAAEQAQRAGRPEEAPVSADGFIDVAANRVRASLLLGEIARQTRLRLENHRVSEMLATIASTYEEPQKVIEMYQRDPQLMGGLRNRAIEDQVVDWVFSAAKVTDQSVNFQQLMQPQA
jgi:trigger factor